MAAQLVDPHTVGVGGVLIDGHRHGDVGDLAGEDLPLLHGGVDLVVLRPLGADIVLIAVQLSFPVWIDGHVRIGGGAHRAPHRLGAVVDDLPEPLLGADQTAPLH